MLGNPVNFQIRQFFRIGQELNYRKHDIILGNEAIPDGVYYIVKGFVKVYAISDKGDEHIHLIYGQTEVFPILWAYLDKQPESLFYEALSDTKLLRIHIDTFRKKISSSLEMCYAMSMQLAFQTRIFTDRIDNLEYKKASERVAYRLLFLANRFGTKYGDGIVIEAPLTHEIFGNSINLARESVSRQVEILEKENIIKKYNNHILIKDIEGLKSKLSRPGNLSNWDIN